MNPADWPQQFAKMVHAAPSCFVPLAKSDVSDVIIMCKGVLDGSPCFVTIGLATKCNTSATELSDADIENELATFNRMFSNKLSPGVSKKRTQINLLFVCCTGPFNYTRKREAGRQEYLKIEKKGFEHITEAFFIDLSTPESRSRFFGLTRENDMNLRDNLEIMIRERPQ